MKEAMVASSVIDVARGTGTLLAGRTVLRQVPYRLFRAGGDAAAASRMPGPIEGTVDITGIGEAAVLAGVEDLVLMLEDGRRLAVALTSSAGHILIRGLAPGPDRLQDFGRRYTAAWCSQNPDSVARFFAPDGSLAVNAGPPAVGRTAIATVARGFMDAFPDLRVLMDGVAADGPRVTYRWTLVGTNTGPGGTGRPVRISGFESWRFSEDGLIAESLGHFDAEDYQRQLDGR